MSSAEVCSRPPASCCAACSRCAAVGGVQWRLPARRHQSLERHLSQQAAADGGDDDDASRSASGDHRQRGPSVPSCGKWYRTYYTTLLPPYHTQKKWQWYGYCHIGGTPIRNGESYTRIQRRHYDMWCVRVGYAVFLIQSALDAMQWELQMQCKSISHRQLDSPTEAISMQRARAGSGIALSSH